MTLDEMTTEGCLTGTLPEAESKFFSLKEGSGQCGIASTEVYSLCFLDIRMNSGSS